MDCNPLAHSIRLLSQTRLHRNPACKLESVGMLKFVSQKRRASACCLDARPEGGRVPPRRSCARSLTCSPLTGITGFRRAYGEYLPFVEADCKAKVLRYRRWP